MDRDDPTRKITRRRLLVGIGAGGFFSICRSIGGVIFGFSARVAQAGGSVPFAYWRKVIGPTLVTQAYAEAVLTRSTNLAVTQAYAELVSRQAPTTLVTQIYGESITSAIIHLRVTQSYMEVFLTQAGGPRITQVYAEVIMST